MRAFHYATIGVIASVIVVACLERPSSAGPTSPIPQPRPNAIRATTPAYSPQGDSIGHVSGLVVLQPALGSTVLVLAVDITPSDGDVDRIFVLQSESPLGVEQAVYKSANVYYTRKAVVVSIPSERRAYVLHLADAAFKYPAGVPQSRTTVVNGFGLTKRPGWFTLGNGTISAPQLEQIFSLSCNIRAAGTIAPFSELYCSSGGRGSTSCSITCAQTDPPTVGYPSSCETSCASGYFSCCNCFPYSGATCQCHRET